MPREYELAEEDFREPTAFAAKIRVKYLVEKFMEDAWVLMARLPATSEPEQMENLCFALGGKIRVQDVTLQAYVIDQEFE